MHRRLIFLSGLALVSAVAHAESGAFFFDSADLPSRPRAAFAAEQRERLLADAYDCNKAGKSMDETVRCQERTRAALQAIAERTRQNHQAAMPQRQEMRRLHQNASQSSLP